MLQDKQRILAGCCQLLPSLKHAKVVSDWAGLRPARERVRLELAFHQVIVHCLLTCCSLSCSLNFAHNCTLTAAGWSRSCLAEQTWKQTGAQLLQCLLGQAGSATSCCFECVLWCASLLVLCARLKHVLEQTSTEGVNHTSHQVLTCMMLTSGMLLSCKPSWCL